ncbi:hypothetical protein GCM10010964_43600 [Caldovatus sediminis]|uniref:Uncharacterized protein n=1 Tax=Caldovatus sediminis TaxID=2041189 RepID=A0A8J2ZFU9_9PROT|nr:hypothetical protein [Caldovatus sediminis]GGG51711.1 hypothetical protein GCM10010964_43600 [Caldovatus sediminis]
MQVRTLRPCEIAGRTVRPDLCLDLPEEEARRLVEAGDAEAWPPPAPPAEASQPAAARPFRGRAAPEDRE